MNGTMVTLVGHVISEVRYATTAGGVPVASFRLAATDRRFDRQRQTWVDGDTSFFTVWSWRWLAENVLSSVGRGDPLLVTGRMRVREWDNGEGNPRGVAAEIEATAIGHDLSRGTSAFRRAVRGRPELVARGSSRAVDDGTGPDRLSRPVSVGVGVGVGIGASAGNADERGRDERDRAGGTEAAPLPSSAAQPAQGAGAGPAPGPGPGPVAAQAPAAPLPLPLPVLVGAAVGRGDARAGGHQDRADRGASPVGDGSEGGG
jgi:single-strand DNA-binding protein